MASFFHLLKILWKRRSDLIEFLDLLPQLLKDAGEGIEAAGKSSKTFGSYMRGGSGVPVNARQIMAETADCINTSQQLLLNAANVINTAGSQINQVKIPVLDVTYTDINFGITTWKVVGSIGIEEKRLFQPVSTALSNSSTELKNMRLSLKNAADQLTELSKWFDSAGKEMNEVGDTLIDGGRALKRLG
jgi:hypothetical protein